MTSWIRIWWFYREKAQNLPYRISLERVLKQIAELSKHIAWLCFEHTRNKRNRYWMALVNKKRGACIAVSSNRTELQRKWKDPLQGTMSTHSKYTLSPNKTQKWLLHVSVIHSFRIIGHCYLANSSPCSAYFDCKIVN